MSFLDSILDTLRPRRTLSLYIGRRFSALFLADLLVFSLVYILVDSLNKYDAFIDAAGNDTLKFFAVAIRYYYYEMPGLFCRILGPAVTMASGMFAVTVTARANEFVPILATGTSLPRAVFPVLALGTVIAGLSFATQEVWIPSHRNQIREARGLAEKKGEIRHVYHIDNQNLIDFASLRYQPIDQRASGVFVWRRNDHGHTVYTSQQAVWDADEKHWWLENGEIQRYDKDGLVTIPVETVSEEPKTAVSEHFKRVPLDGTTMIPQDLEGSDSQYDYLSQSELKRKAAVAPDGHNWLIKYYSRFVDPLHHIILLLLGIPTIFIRNTRNVFLSALVAVVVATAYFVLHSVFVYLGARRTIDPAMAVWLGPMIFGALGLTMYWHMRT